MLKALYTGELCDYVQCRSCLTESVRPQPVDPASTSTLTSYLLLATCPLARTPIDSYLPTDGCLLPGC